MTHIQIELQDLKARLLEMAKLTSNQVNKSIEAFQTLNISLAQEVIKSERRVNGMELSIDRDCENIMALYNPVAVDLRLVFSVFKINSHLERIGDYAESISRYVLLLNETFSADFLKRLSFFEMAATAIEMLTQITFAIQNENSFVARAVFEKDVILDKINLGANSIISDEIRANPNNTEAYLILLSIIHKLERVGDMSTNIAEEIIFFLEAKVLKHSKGESTEN